MGVQACVESRVVVSVCVEGRRKVAVGAPAALVSEQAAGERLLQGAREYANACVHAFLLECFPRVSQKSSCSPLSVW